MVSCILLCDDNADAWQPNIVLADIGLPDVSGYAVAQEIRQMPSGRDVILMAFTGTAIRRTCASARP